MNKRRRAGTTLIELLVVIVVFLVGILAFVQIFPGGLRVLRDTRAKTVARSLVRSESQRLAGQGMQLPDYIGAVQFVGGGAFVQIDANLNPNELMPPLNDVPTNEGRIRQDGQVLVGGVPVGNWGKVSGANRFSRVLGEGRPVGAPVNTFAFGTGSPVQLTFAPIYYFRDAGTGVGTPGLLTGYTDDLTVRTGDRNNDKPSLVAGLYEPWVVYFVNAADTTNVGVSPFGNQDQLWFNLINEGALVRHDYRLQMTFYYDFGGTVRPVDVVLNVPGQAASAFYQEVNAGTYGVISLPLAIENLSGGAYTAANYRGLVQDSLRFERQYKEIPTSTAFSRDPLEYKVVNNALGTLVVNPLASTVKLPATGGQERPLSFRSDYTVYDWRIIRDEFTVPAAGSLPTSDMKLVLDSIKPRSSSGADGKPWSGLSGPDNALLTFGTNAAEGSQDFVLIDLETGGVIIGNDPAAPISAYYVQKSLGYITFTDTDGNAANGITGTIAYRDPSNPTLWATQANVDLTGRKVRALYMSPNEMAVQVLKAANRYLAVNLPAPTALGAGEVYLGGSGGWGANDRLYFPVSDLGQSVSVGELGEWNEEFRDQQYQISRLEQVGGVTFAVAVLPTSVTLTNNQVPVRRVTGASIRVRAVYNPSTFILGTDEVQNYDAMKTWAKNWSKVDTQTYLGLK